MANTSQILSLYRTLIREAKKFPTYNFREYALRRIRDDFRENKSLINSEQISNKLVQAQKSLELIRRQVIVGQLYSTDKLVIENK